MLLCANTGWQSQLLLFSFSPHRITTTASLHLRLDHSTIRQTNPTIIIWQSVLTSLMPFFVYLILGSIGMTKAFPSLVIFSFQRNTMEVIVMHSPWRRLLEIHTPWRLRWHILLGGYGKTYFLEVMVTRGSWEERRAPSLYQEIAGQGNTLFVT